jgi:hypothetical protein
MLRVYVEKAHAQAWAFLRVRANRGPAGWICERPKLQQRETIFLKGLVLQEKAGFS